MLNNVTIMGRLVIDPGLKATSNGVPVLSFTIACERNFKSEEGKGKQTDFIDIVAWRETAEFINKYFKKGDSIIVTGRLQTRHYSSPTSDAKIKVVEVIASKVDFAGSKKHSDDKEIKIVDEGEYTELPF